MNMCMISIFTILHWFTFESLFVFSRPIPDMLLQFIYFSSQSKHDLDFKNFEH